MRQGRRTGAGMRCALLLLVAAASAMRSSTLPRCPRAASRARPWLPPRARPWSSRTACASARDDDADGDLTFGAETPESPAERRERLTAAFGGLKTAELRSLLDGSGLSTEGSKTALVARLVAQEAGGSGGGAVEVEVASEDADETLSEVRARQREAVLGSAESSAQLESESTLAMLRERRLVDRYVSDSLVRSEGDMAAPDGATMDAYVVSSRSGLDPWGQVSRRRRVEAEVHVVLLLPDVYGWEDADVRNAADRIAANCGCAVAVPDLFRGDAWPRGRDPSGAAYEAWRARHPPSRVAGDVEAAAAAAAETFAAHSLALVGFCFGGGRVIEALAAAAQRGGGGGGGAGGEAQAAERRERAERAARRRTAVEGLGAERAEEISDDFPDLWEALSAPEAPPREAEGGEGRGAGALPYRRDPARWGRGAPVTAAVAFYPTRYDAELARGIEAPLCAVFGAEDATSGATKGDAEALAAAMRENAALRDFHVHVAEGQGHGFAHRALRRSGVETFNDAAKGLGVSPAKGAAKPWADEDFPSGAAAMGEQGDFADDWGDYGSRRPSAFEGPTADFGREQIESGAAAAEDAMMIATAWLDTYMRRFQPTVGARSRAAAEEGEA